MNGIHGVAQTVIGHVICRVNGVQGIPQETAIPTPHNSLPQLHAASSRPIVPSARFPRPNTTL